MKLLVDANLSPRVTKSLVEHGHEAVHVADVGLLDAPDDEIFNYAQLNEFVILSADSDFGTLLARHRSAKPSFVLLRHTNELNVDEQIALVVLNLEGVTSDINTGAVVVITPERIRIRSLPFY